ncbi:hypothetical protein J2Z40_002727 [Cytobacillus eiseniae]|uniref:DUF5673 domain-containing protein n=1 Tax=Cytobacillus eiseniae TaxID=762947 RepID=A0ABS4RGY2_9BACI|nr:hypothetical protein [Cytobacillus eiseniae]MBP2242154.1 hypothetical protein [Cytobacillus eiseniae]
MLFNAVEPKVPLLFSFFMMVVMFIISNWSIYLLLAIMIIVSTNVKYHFKVNDTDLLFTTSLFGLEILKKKARKEQIKLIEFKRTDWDKKSVFIRLEKGFRWKISRFNSDTFDESIENFARTNSINIKKHKK